VFASGPDFATVRDLIAKLDVPRRQVYVDAAILDLSVESAKNLGLSFHGGQQGGGVDAQGVHDWTAVGASGSGSLITDAKSAAALFGAGGLTAGILGKGIDVAGVTL